MGFKKNDQKKLKWNLSPIEALEEVVKVLEFGAERYGAKNWLENSSEVQWSRYMNALERHFVKFKKGQDYDEESNLLELAHLATNSLMLLQYQLLGLGIDDRDYRIGQKFGKLKLLSFKEMRNKSERIYNVICDCGNSSQASYNNMRIGNTTSCGCYSKEITSRSNKTHGKSNQPIYNRYRAMMSRCYDSKSIQYKNYGERGILVDEDWHTFEGFFSDMGYPPTPKHQIDRINNDGPYSRENCRWITAKENVKNSPKTLKLLYKGKEKTIRELSEEYNLNWKCLKKRLSLGWDLETALKTPSGEKRKLK